MNKLAQLINKINKFSIDSHWGYRIVKLAEDSSALLQRAENFDIKDEELFTQFENFIKSYESFLEKLDITPENLNEESLVEAGQILDTLKLRYDRIINNPYLNISDKTGYDEDFDPGDFTQLINDMAQDAKNRLEAVAGDEVDISEMMAQQYANEFNQVDIDKRDQNVTWTGDKVHQALEARKRRAEEIKFLKKFNPQDPRVVALVESRRRYYENLKQDPQRYKHFAQKALERGQRRREKIYNEYIGKRKDTKTLKGLLREISDFKESIDPEKLEEDYQGVQHSYYIKEKEKAKKIREKKEKGDLDGLLIHLTQRVATQKGTIKQSIGDTLKKSIKAGGDVPPELSQAKQKWIEAFNAKDQQALVEATKFLNKAVSSYAESRPEVAQFVEKANRFRDFKKKVEVIEKNKWLDPENLPMAREHIGSIIMDGYNLMREFRDEKPFRTLVDATMNIVKYLQQRA